MTIQSKEQVFNEVMSGEKPKCPHCGKEMSLWEVPQVAVSDGLGWGVPFLFVCFNDECPPFKSGWDNIEQNYAFKASYRCINYPGTQNFDFMSVFSEEGGKGQIYDDEAKKLEESFKEELKFSFSALTDFYIQKAWDEILKFLLDPQKPGRVRLKAAEMVGDIGGEEALPYLLNKKFPNELIQKEVDKAVEKLHKRHFTRECPFCAEIIKQRAKICKHCKMSL